MNRTTDKNDDCSSLKISELQEAARTLRLLAHPFRLKIIDILESSPEGAPVNSLVAQLNIPQSAVSQHLNSMQRAGLLKSLRQGKEVWYRIDSEKPLKILNCIRTRRSN